MAIKRQLARLLALLLAGTPAAAQFPPAGPAAGSQPVGTPFTPPPVAAEALAEHTRYERLSNGLRSVVVEQRGIPLLSVQLWFDAGAGDDGELPGTCAAATRLLAGRDDAEKRLRAAALQFEVEVLADGTAFRAVIPADTDLLVQVLARYAEILSPLTADQATGRGNAGSPPLRLQHAAGDTHTDAGRFEADLRIPPAVRARLFEAHPYALPAVSGEAIDVEQLAAFAQTWFVPANATLLIVGDIALPTGQELVRQRFGALPRRDKPRRAWPELPSGPLPEPPADGAGAQALALAWVTPYYVDYANAVLEVLMHRLCNSVDGPLYRALRAGGFAAPRWRLVRQRAAGVLLLSVGLGDPQDAGAAAALQRQLAGIVRAELQRAADAPASELELLRARALAQAQVRSGRAGFAAFADLLGRHELLGGDVLLADLDLGRTEHVTVGELQDSAAYLLEARATAVPIPLPEEPTGSAEPDEPLQALRFWAELPAVDPPPRVTAKYYQVVDGTTPAAMHIRVLQHRSPGTWVWRAGGAAALLRLPLNDQQIEDLATFRSVQQYRRDSAGAQSVSWAGPADETGLLLTLALRGTAATSSPASRSADPPRLGMVASQDELATAVADLGSGLSVAAIDAPPLQPPPRYSTRFQPADAATTQIRVRIPALFALPPIDQIAAARLLNGRTAALAGDAGAERGWSIEFDAHGVLMLECNVPNAQTGASYQQLRERLAQLRQNSVPPADWAAAVQRARIDAFAVFASPEHLARDLARTAPLLGRLDAERNATADLPACVASALQRPRALAIEQVGGKAAALLGAQLAPAGEMQAD